jgi:hypothetical protein
MKPRHEIVLAVVVTMMIASVIWASVTFTPPGSTQKMLMSSLPMRASSAAPKASGVLSIVSNPAMTKFDLTVEARGLDPKKVYTVSFVNTTMVNGKSKTQMSGIGTAPYAVKPDSKGYAKVAVSVNYDPRKKWQTVEIVEHPDKNPKNMNKIVPILTGDVNKLG